MKKVGIISSIVLIVIFAGICFIEPIQQEMPPTNLPSSIGVSGDQVTILIEEFPEVVPQIGDRASNVIESYGWLPEDVEDDVGELEEFDGTLVLLNVGGDFFIEMAIENDIIVSVESETNRRFRYRSTAEPLE